MNDIRSSINLATWTFWFFWIAIVDIHEVDQFWLDKPPIDELTQILVGNWNVRVFILEQKHAVPSKHNSIQMSQLLRFSLLQSDTI